MVAIEQPPGVRSTRDGGTWMWCRSANGTNFVLQDLASLEQSLSLQMLAMVKAELRDLMDAATRGELSYGGGREYDIEQMEAAPDVLELRLSARAGGLHLRVFFSEPAHIPGALVALMFYWKRPGPVDLEDQTFNAKVASRRLDEWCRREDSKS